MFETSVIRVQSHNSRRYQFLTLSLAAHGCAIAAVITATIANTRLPIEAPRQMETPIFLPAVSLPPASGTPQGQPAKPKAAAATALPVPVAPAAPQAIPEASDPVTITGVATTTDGGGGSGDAIGVPVAVPGGIGTDAAGIGDAVPRRVVGEIKAPIVIHRVLPDYPRAAVLGRISGWVIVECIIDKTGHIRDARVLKSSFGAFERPALDAVQQWVFSPGTLRGEPVDTIFDLTVTFQLR